MTEARSKTLRTPQNAPARAVSWPDHLEGRSLGAMEKLGAGLGSAGLWPLARPGGSGSVMEERVTVYSIIGFGRFAVQFRPYLLVSKYLVMNEFLPVTLQV